ncbi:S8 family peptidase [Marinobacter koreensis]|uniref:S8 family peptidase n=1 Tax=Marinobacter koreensis TaxID=335974 RepID=A0ABW0RJM8_9GAMM|nr:S8 family peptidase [Marinobacter koreensis]MCK7546479.1 S8 family peptidase [Marinobacter koreensis]
MAERKRHLLVKRHSFSEPFSNRSPVPSKGVPSRQREQHGRQLLENIRNSFIEHDQKRQNQQNFLDENPGIYIEIKGYPNQPLPLEKLDNRDFDLRQVRLDGEIEAALVFIPENRRNAFTRKIEKYLDPRKDARGKPGNQALVDSIESVRLANIRSFWTDAASAFPRDHNQRNWLELWLKAPNQLESIPTIKAQLAEITNATISSHQLNFFDTTVLLAHASTAELERAVTLFGCLEELRLAKQPATFWGGLSNQDQQEWADELLNRLQPSDDFGVTSATILDSGVNHDHPLLRPFTDGQKSTVWAPMWPKYDFYNPPAPYEPHGSLQAGLAIYGDLRDTLASPHPFSVPFDLESARILPPAGGNQPDLYGAITRGTALKLEIDRPNRNRVYSLAVTAEPEPITGQPSSWSAEIDSFTSGIEDDVRRIFLISAGNATAVQPTPDHWDQVSNTPIEDPAQAWNAVTVGAFTDNDVIDDPTFQGWTPLASKGDVAPQSRSSLCWDWVDQAPFKPDFVMEGGNYLLSPNQTTTDAADTVALLTTSGRSTSPLFEYHGDTSAACALATNYAAHLWATYPDYWPETIRGLLTHSAEWTEKMRSRFKSLLANKSPAEAKAEMLRVVGNGVPNLGKAISSANNYLTLITENYIQPFRKKDGARPSDDPSLNEMHLVRLPWPRAKLAELPPETRVRLKVTLSYFIEPNPGRRGYRSKFRYQSFGLRFAVLRPQQSEPNFRAMINDEAKDPSYDGPEGDDNGWQFGSRLRSRGSIHCDTWEGTAADLALRHTLAVYPVSGWWKYRKAKERWRSSARYSLIVSLEVPENSVDIYSEVENYVSVGASTSVQV